MPAISTEIMSLAILIVISVVLYKKNTLKRDNPVHEAFGRLMITAYLETFLQAIVSYLTFHPEILPASYRIALSLVYHLSVMFVLFLSFAYLKRMINQEAPENERLGIWTDYVVGVAIIICIILPIIGLKLDGEAIHFEFYVHLSFVIMVLIELFSLFLILYKRKYLDYKTVNIISIAFVGRIFCIVLKSLCLAYYFENVGIIIMLISYFLTLESSDVYLIKDLILEKEKADRANEAKSLFTANVSHNIRTPINAILGMNEMILRETHEENTRQYAFDIKAAGQSLLSIINEILDLSKIEAGLIEIMPVNYSLRSLVNDTVSVAQIKMNEKRLQFIVEVSDTLPAGYKGDVVRIKQILTNILSNAAKYTNEGSVTLSITGDALLDKKELLHFEIRDTGIGMKEEDLERISEEFLRFDNRKNKDVEGSGIGMSLTTEFLRLMGSSLKVESEYGKGSVFSFDLEQEIWDESYVGDIRNNVAEQKVRYSYEKSFVSPSTRVLVVDDNLMNRKVFTGLLKDTRLIIDEAASGEECLRMVKEQKYDIIFMDHIMPIMDGVETFHRLKEEEDNLSKDAKVIMLTANALSGARDNYIDEGFDDFLSKPIDHIELEEMIKRHIEG